MNSFSLVGGDGTCGHADRSRDRRITRVLLVAALVCTAAIAGSCSTLPERTPYVADELNGTRVVGFPEDIRFWADSSSEVIINNRVAPQFDMPRRGIVSIASRSISTLIKMQGASGARDIYHLARRTRTDFNLAYVDEGFTEVTPAPFDRAYMNKLFAYGYAHGRQGYKWKKVPPGLELVDAPP